MIAVSNAAPAGSDARTSTLKLVPGATVIVDWIPAVDGSMSTARITPHAGAAA
jgi:hypothetical protein